jgi:glycopeptide antibiotics resistance protein
VRDPEPGGRPRLRAWCAWLALGVAAFAAYISLVPFNFRMPSGGWAIALSSSLEMRVGISGNFLANGVMLAPFGFFAAGALFGPRAGAIWKASGALLILLVSVSLSVTIEGLQVFVPGRTPSLGDITAQTAGTIVGLIAWLVLGRDVRVWSQKFASGTGDVLRLLLAAYAVVSAFSLLHPLDVTVDLGLLAHRWRAGRIILNPLHSDALQWDALPSVISDFVLAVPIGLFAALAGTAPGARRATVRALALGAIFFGLGELAQVLVQSRTADTFDLIVNLTGMATGVWLVTLTVSQQTGEQEQPGSLVPVAGLVCCAALYVAYNWSPYAFTISAAMFRHRFEPLMAPPFRGYYLNPDFKALGDILVKTAMTMPIGIFLERWLRFGRSPYRRLLMACALVVAAGVFGAVELGQVFLPSRYPDDTDVLLAVGGVWLGIRVARPFDRPAQRAATAAASSLDRVR